MRRPGTIEGFRSNLGTLVAIDDYVGGLPVLQRLDDGPKGYIIFQDADQVSTDQR